MYAAIPVIADCVTVGIFAFLPINLGTIIDRGHFLLLFLEIQFSCDF